MGGFWVVVDQGGFRRVEEIEPGHEVEHVDVEVTVAAREQVGGRRHRREIREVRAHLLHLDVLEDQRRKIRSKRRAFTSCQSSDRRSTVSASSRHRATMGGKSNAAT